MNQLKCHIVEDLLPLYIDGMCSEETKKDVKEHLDVCVRCRHIYEEMSSELIESLPVPEFETKKIFRSAQKSIAGITVALAAVFSCIAINIGGAWEGGPAGAGSFAVTVAYILFWCLFLFFSRKYAPMIKASGIVSAITFVSSAVGFCAALLDRGGFITAFFSLFASVPFYGLRFLAGWKTVYASAAVISLCWMLYALRAQKQLARMQEE